MRTNSAIGLLATNILLERQLWLRQQLEGLRDIDAECGHPSEISIVDCIRAFQRGDVAARVVEIWPLESWADDPQIFETEDEKETEFEKQWLVLEEQFQLLSLMQRVDILSGVGRFGLLLLGLNDGQLLDRPAAGINEKTGVADPTPGRNTLIYARAFSEDLIKVDSFEEDVTSPRYGLPKLYDINFKTANTNTSSSKKVHWTRVVHVADNRTSDEVFGMPRMERVYNRLLDLKKIVSGSGEMFWKGGFPGLSLEAGIGEDGSTVEIDEEATKKQIDAYQNGLQRYLALVGMQAKSLAPQVADPASHVEVQLKLIAAALGVPWRVFIGSEAAQLASQQDTRAWGKRLAGRRSKYLTPFLIKPILERLIAFGALPKPNEGPRVFWPDPHSPSEQEKAEIGKQRTEALSKYAISGADMVIPPFHFLTHFLDFDQEEAQSILEAAEERADEVGDEEEEALEAEREHQRSLVARNNGQ